MISLINPNILTEEQKEILKIIYDEAKEDLDSEFDAASTMGFARTTLLESLFGKEFFKKYE